MPVLRKEHDKEQGSCRREGNQESREIYQKGNLQVRRFTEHLYSRKCNQRSQQELQILWKQFTPFFLCIILRILLRVILCLRIILCMCLRLCFFGTCRMLS